MTEHQDAQGNEDTTTIGDEDTPKADQDHERSGR